MLGLVSLSTQAFNIPALANQRPASTVAMMDRVFPPSLAKGGNDVVPERTALLFIEYQNEVRTPSRAGHLSAAAAFLHEPPVLPLTAVR